MTVSDHQKILDIQAELEKGIHLSKCQKCGCMDSALQNLATVLPSLESVVASELVSKVRVYQQKMRPIKYTCLGCEVCYPALAQNMLSQAFPSLGDQAIDLSCEFRIRDEEWPPVAGEYKVLDPSSTVAVSTLASVQLVEELVRRKPNGLALVGKTETENIGIDKIIKNMISSPTIRCLILAGADPKGHLPGQTLLALFQNGVDEDSRVIGSAGKHPVLRNVTIEEIQAFRDQVQVIDMIGIDNPDVIAARVEEFAKLVPATCGFSECGGKPAITVTTPEKLIAVESHETVKLDKVGYFVIIPMADTKLIHVETYTYDNELIQVIEGKTASAIYKTIIDRGWVTELSHAAYLGKELTKAELSFQYGFPYNQDGA